MHTLFWTDLMLTLLTFTGSCYLYSSGKITISYALIISVIYISSKIIGYIILPYSKFEIFIEHLSSHSKLSFLSGFEIFKTTLVAILYFGFIFIDPFIWILESVLVVAMRIWGLSFTKAQKND